MSRLRWMPVGLLSMLLSMPAAAQDGVGWTRFRGPNGSGVADVADLPTEFSPTQSVVWSQEVPFGRSSPVLGDRHVFLTGIDDGALVVLALDRRSGDVAWRTAFDPGYEVEMYSANNAASPTPVTDGENVYVVFATLGVVALDGDGNEMWRLPMGPLRNFYGHAASPVLAGDTLLVVVDQFRDSVLLALEARTGVERWRRERPGRVESWTTPVLYPSAADAREVLVSGSKWLDAYSIETGEPFWEVAGFGYWPVASPVVSGGVLVASAPDQAGEPPPPFSTHLEGGDVNGDGALDLDELRNIDRLSAWGDHFGFLDADDDGLFDAQEYVDNMESIYTEEYGAVGVRLPAAGAGGTAELLWREKRAVPYNSTPIVHDGLAYLLTDRGILSVLELETGALVRRDRLSSAGANLMSSPVLADGKIYVATQDGAVIVLSAGADWEILAVNDLGEPMFATPAVAPGRLFIRTQARVYAFGQPE